MAAHVQVLLPLICVALAEAHFSVHLPFFGLPGDLPPNSGLTRENQLINSNEDNFSHESWFHHNWPRHIHREHDKFNPFNNGGRDPYFDTNLNPFGRGNYGPVIKKWPGINNVFNMPGYNSNKSKPRKETHPEQPKKDHKVGIKGKTFNDKPQEISPIDNKPVGEIPKPTNTDSGVPSNADNIPKTNEKQLSGDGGEDEKQVGLKKKKDFLLVGHGNNGNNVYLLHENRPNPTVVIPNTNQPSPKVIYVSYNPGQSNNQVYQVVGSHPAPLTTGSIAQDKSNSNGYNNAIPNFRQPIINSNYNQNPGYVMIYSNGQLLKIPGVVVNSVQNNAPQQNGYPVQGTQYIVANSLPTNVQNEAVQNPGNHIIYTTLPNQHSNGPIVLQIPNCVHNIPNNNMCGSGATGQNPVQVVSVPGNLPNQNIGVQQAVLVQNGAQPNDAPNQVQGQIQGPNTDQNGPFQPPIKEPVKGCSNGYNQPMTNQGSIIAVNAPNQAAVVTNQNTPIQSAVEIPVNTGSVVNQGPNAAINPPNQGNQETTNAIVNAPSDDTVPNNENLVLDTNNMSAIGAQPAIMISGFKDTTAHKKDNTNSKNDKSKKKDKKK